MSQRVNAIVGKIREMRRGPYRPHLYIVKEDGEPSLRLWALSMLVEDRFEQSPSYMQFLVSVDGVLLLAAPFLLLVATGRWTDAILTSLVLLVLRRETRASYATRSTRTRRTDVPPSLPTDRIPRYLPHPSSRPASYARTEGGSLTRTRVKSAVVRVKSAIVIHRSVGLSIHVCKTKREK